MTQTILFVDEEKFVHKALKRSFRKMREKWDMHFAAGPSEALEILNKNSIEVIVTETIFQGQSGFDFLKAVREEHPHSVRIILSGYSDRNVVLKTVDLAHQYLAKPCDDDTLKATIDRAVLIKKLLDHQPLKKIVSQIDSLPSLPALYVELVEELKSEDASIEKIGEIISKDIGLSAKIIKLVNSSFFGLRQQITNPAKAVSLLGLDLIKAIVLTSGTFDKFNKLKYPGFSLEQIWEHAMLTGTFAKIMARQSGLDRKDADTVFMAGLLHDVGKLLIAAHLPDSFSKINGLASWNSISMADAEIEVIGTTHGGVGAYLLGLWGLPDAILEAVAFHHTPSKMASTSSYCSGIVHVANALAGSGQASYQSQGIIDGLDYEYLQEADLLPNLELWKSACTDYLTDNKS